METFKTEGKTIEEILDNNSVALLTLALSKAEEDNTILSKLLDYLLKFKSKDNLNDEKSIKELIKMVKEKKNLHKKC